MKTDWQKRARDEDLFPFVSPNEYVVGSTDEWRRRALKLANEMADARAEEIAQECEHRISVIEQGEHTTKPEHVRYERGIKAGLDHAARIARSTISKPEFTLPRPLSTIGSRPLTPDECKAWGQEAGATVQWDETGFEIVGAPEKQKSREQVLEDALRQLGVCNCYDDASRSGLTCLPWCNSIVADRALEWKPA